MKAYINNLEFSGKNLSKGLGIIKIPLTILTFNRPECLDKTLDSFIRLNYDCLDNFMLTILNQGTDKETREVVHKYRDSVDIYIEKENKGCAWGYTYLVEKFLDHPYIMHLQDDWYSVEPLTQYLDQIYRMFEQNSNVGYIRLRSSRSRVCKYNGITEERIQYKRWPRRFPWSRIYVGNSHFTLNPSIIRSDVLKQMLPISEERDAMEKYHNLGLQSAQLEANCFIHIGFKRAMAEGRKKWIR